MCRLGARKSLGGIQGIISFRQSHTHLVTVLHAEVVVLEVDVDVRKDELLTDLLPDDAGHLVTVHLDDGVLGLDTLNAGGSGGVSLGRHVGGEEDAGDGGRGVASSNRGTQDGGELYDQGE